MIDCICKLKFSFSLSIPSTIPAVTFPEVGRMHNKHFCIQADPEDQVKSILCTRISLLSSTKHNSLHKGQVRSPNLLLGNPECAEENTHTSKIKNLKKHQ